MFQLESGRNVISMTNGCIGVSILAMPYCFSKCGILLGLVVLSLSGLMTSYSCKLLIQTAVIQRSRTLEFLSFKTLGKNGKLFTEICIIFLLIGTLVLYLETLGDTAPPFLAKLCNYHVEDMPRSLIMIIGTGLIALPLSLSRKLEKLNHLSAFSIAFYYFFSLYCTWMAYDKTNQSDFEFSRIKLWDMSGLLEIVPIFSISFSCQTVLFIVYDEMPDGSRDSMFKIIDFSVIVVFIAYFLAGIFGYIAFYDANIQGNIIRNLPDTGFNQVIFFGFLICVFSSFPFMVFPCRISINTLLFSQKTKIDDSLESEFHMPDYRFNNITYIVVAISTLAALFIPNIEFILAFSGATTGSIICYILPALIFIYNKYDEKEHGSNTNEGSCFANFFLCVGFFIFVLCTTATLMNMPSKVNIEPMIENAHPVDTVVLLNLPTSTIENKLIKTKIQAAPIVNESVMNVMLVENEKRELLVELAKKSTNMTKTTTTTTTTKKSVKLDETRKEPPVPEIDPSDMKKSQQKEVDAKLPIKDAKNLLITKLVHKRDERAVEYNSTIAENEKIL